MQITKCDVCGRLIEASRITIKITERLERFPDLDICEKCAEPVIAFLKAYRDVPTAEY